MYISVVTNNNTSANMTISISNVSYWEQIFVAFLVGLIAITGIVANSMIIVAVSFSRKLQTPTNVFVTSLSVTDLLTSFFLIWFAVGLLGKNGWPVPRAYWICVLSGCMLYACIGTSVYNLAAIGINRLVLVTNPSLYRKIFTSWKLGILVAVPWIVPGGTFVSLLATGNGAIGYSVRSHSCTDLDSHKKAYVFDLAETLVSSIPVFAIVVSYTWIYIFLKKHFRAQKRYAEQPTISSSRSNDDPPSKMSVQDDSMSATRSSPDDIAPATRRREQISRQQIEITKNLFLVVCVFFACFPPFFILQTLPETSFKSHFEFYVPLAPFANSVLNFVIYARRHPDFKVVLRHVMRRSYADISQPSRLLRFLLHGDN